MTENTICKEGLVRAIHGDNVEVEITVSSACSECHAKSICIPSDHQKETIVAKKLYNESFEVNERVHLVLQKSEGRKAIIIVYFIPSILLILSLVGIYALTQNELAASIVSLLSLIIYCLILKLRHKKNRDVFTFFVKKM